jgi:ABC-type transport system involved in cytochrome c biogenesis ATPase subunit/GNAT superfamily N-acetyltransferase
MPRVDLVVNVDVARSARVTQLEGLFDVPRAERAAAEYHFDVPLEERPWQVGLITGPSGAGKSTVARHLFGDNLVERYDWGRGRAVVDCFGALGIREISAALSSVGFSSPPSWLKPYSVLSNGEKFRADLARAIVDERELVVVDEFTSVVDRTVGRVGANAVAKAVRARPGKRFVAVTCHDDVTDWLQPDWILEPHVGAFAWREVQRRPKVALEVVRANHAAWSWFHPHHYLTADLNRAARCFVGLVDGRPACFAGILHMPHPKRSDLCSLSRIVVLPDFQGLGLGAHAFSETIARLCKSNGRTLCVGTSHPALIGTWAKSKLWHMTGKPGFQNPPGKTAGKSAGQYMQKHAAHRRVAHFQWRGGTLEDGALAKRMWSCS